MSSSGFIVSLTSYPPRFVNLAKVLHELNKQSLFPELLILNIAHGDIDLLPVEVRKIALNFPIEIRSVDDLGPGTKLIPTLITHADKVVITIDDDILYPPALFEKLMQESAHDPGSIIGARGHIPRFQENEPIPYLSWKFLVSNSDRGVFMPTGVGGVLYPPNSLHPDVIDFNLYKEMSYTTDDIWYWVHAIRNLTTVKKSKFEYELAPVSGFKNVTLESGNMSVLNNISLSVLWNQFQMTKQLEIYASKNDLEILGHSDMSEFELFLCGLRTKFMPQGTYKILQDLKQESQLTIARELSTLQGEIELLHIASRSISANYRNVINNVTRKVKKILRN